MMTNRFPHRRNRSWVPPAVVLVFAGIVAFAAVALLSPGMPGWLTAAGHQAARPFWHAGDAMNAAVFGSVAMVESKQSLIAENTRLYEEVSALRQEAFAARILRNENRRLRELLGRPEHAEPLAAAVLAHPSATLYDTLIIDAGAAQGIAIGDVVTVTGGSAIGEVVEAFPKTATVRLYSAPGVETPVVIGTGATTTQAIAVGWGGGNFTISLPRDVPIAEGEPVSMAGIVPRLFAVIEEVERVPEESFITVRFQMPVNVSDLRYVIVERAHMEEEGGTQDSVPSSDAE